MQLSGRDSDRFYPRCCPRESAQGTSPPTSAWTRTGTGQCESVCQSESTFHTCEAQWRELELLSCFAKLRRAATRWLFEKGQCSLHAWRGWQHSWALELDARGFTWQCWVSCSPQRPCTAQCMTTSAAFFLQSMKPKSFPVYFLITMHISYKCIIYIPCSGVSLAAKRSKLGSALPQFSREWLSVVQGSTTDAHECIVLFCAECVLRDLMFTAVDITNRHTLFPPLQAQHEPGAGISGFQSVCTVCTHRLNLCSFSASRGGVASSHYLLLSKDAPATPLSPLGFGSCLEIIIAGNFCLLLDNW